MEKSPKILLGLSPTDPPISSPIIEFKCRVKGVMSPEACIFFVGVMLAARDGCRKALAADEKKSVARKSLFGVALEGVLKGS